jgi:hypothetical protein
MRRFALFLPLLWLPCVPLGAQQIGTSNGDVGVIGGIGGTGGIVGGTSAAYANFIARTSGLDNAHKNAYGALLDGLMTDGLFNSNGTSSYFDALYVFATANATTAKLNLVSSSYTCTLTGTPTFTPDRGYSGSGGNLVDTNLNSATAGGFVTTNALHFSVWDNTATVGDGNEIVGVVSGATLAHIYPDYANTGLSYARIESVSGPGVAVSNAHGFYIANRSGASATQVYKDGASTGTSTDTAGGLLNGDWFFPGPNVSSSDPVLGGSFGGSLTSAQVANFYARMHTYMQTIAGVP